jgi:DNA topoisomerase IA
VKPDEDFAMTWDIDGKSIKHVKEIADAMKEADGLILATDPDREGEAISWHVLEALKQPEGAQGQDDQRVTFNAITKKAVTDAINAPRQIDQQLVDAYLARRALDYLVGFTLSPVLWRKLPGAAPPAACSPWRCASSSIARSRSSASSARNTGTSPPSFRSTDRNSKRVLPNSTANACRNSTCRTPPWPPLRSPR